MRLVRTVGGGWCGLSVEVGGCSFFNTGRSSRLADFSQPRLRNRQQDSGFRSAATGMNVARHGLRMEPMPGYDGALPNPRGVKLTYDDFVLFPEDGQRHELIDGEHYVTPSPDPKHQAHRPQSVSR